MHKSVLIIREKIDIIFLYISESKLSSDQARTIGVFALYVSDNVIPSSFFGTWEVNRRRPDPELRGQLIFVRITSLSSLAVYVFFFFSFLSKIGIYLYIVRMKERGLCTQRSRELYGVYTTTGRT
jgi:hypothetical protein